QVAVVVYVHHVAGHAVVLQAQLAVGERVKLGGGQAQAVDGVAQSQAHGGGGQHIAGGVEAGGDGRAAG
nr:hypothetical protein [Tanacetum cinerariifolium]